MIPIHQLELKHQEAIRMYKTGQRLCFSTDIADALSMGYGQLDHNGFWEYPLYERDLTDKDKIRFRLILGKD